NIRQPVCMRFKQRLANASVRTLLRWLLRVSVSAAPGSEHKLRTGGVLVASTLLSTLDPFLIALACPSPLLVMVSPRFIASDLNWSLLRVAKAGGLGNVIIVDEHRPFGVRTVVRALRSGQNVLMFPEGSIGEEGPKAWQAGFLW